MTKTSTLEGCQNPRMASTYICLRTHFVFATRSREPLIAGAWRPELHAYIGGVTRSLGATPLVIGGTDDHVHLLAGLKATHAPADFIREVKKVSSPWAAQHCGGFAWQVGYAAFSIGRDERGAVSAYIARQEDHHRQRSSAEELRELLKEYGIPLDDRYFE